MRHRVRWIRLLGAPQGLCRLREMSEVSTASWGQEHLLSPLCRQDSPSLSQGWRDRGQCPQGFPTASFHRQWSFLKTVRASGAAEPGAGRSRCPAALVVPAELCSWPQSTDTFPGARSAQLPRLKAALPCRARRLSGGDSGPGQARRLRRQPRGAQAGGVSGRDVAGMWPQSRAPAETAGS